MVPLAIFFEATQSADTNGRSIDSHGQLGNNILEYTWDFGDDATFSGFNAAHVYETPGDYTVSLTIRDATGVASTTQVISAEPFSGETTCFANVGSDFAACPAGASQVTTGSFGDVLSHAGSNRRLLMRRGDTFIYTSEGRVSETNMVIGAFGPGSSALRN